MALKALIADDSAFMRDIIRHYLEFFGCEVIAEAENALQAVRLCRALRPDLVTLDVVMPQVDGIDALAAFREIRKDNPNLPIIVISAMPFDHTRQTFLAEGALDYIVKPLTPNTFKQVYRKLKQLFPELHDV